MTPALLTPTIFFLSLSNLKYHQHSTNDSSSTNLHSSQYLHLSGIDEIEHKSEELVLSRRGALQSSFIKISSGATLLASLPSPSWSYANSAANVRISIANPEQRLNVELMEVRIGNPPRTVIAVKSLDPFGLAGKRGVQPGMILPEFSSRSQLLQKLQNEDSYPVCLDFVNLAAGGDAFGDLGKPLVTAEDALDVARQNSATAESPSESPLSSKSSNSGYSVTTRRKPALCTIQSRRGDVMEIQYTASYYLNGNADQGNRLVYDSSAQRGTGLPYQFVLGSGDMIPGVDQGLYEMCPGEIRAIEIPKQLGYGDKGNKLFRIPGGTKLFWTVELVAVNSIREGDERTREDME